MFILRYLMVALAVAFTTAVWGISAGCSVWQVLGLMFAATLALQALIVGWVGIAAHRRKQLGPSGRGVRKRSDQLVILPR